MVLDGVSDILNRVYTRTEMSSKTEEQQGLEISNPGIKKLL